MKSRRWRIVVDLVALALISALVGGLVGRRITRSELEARNSPQHWNEEVLEEFVQRVHPTAEQLGKVRVHLDAAVRDLQSIRRDTVTRSAEVIGRLVSAVETELGPEQRRAFEGMKPSPGELDLDILNTSPR